MQQVDINSDLGESFGAYVMGNDGEMLKVITSANVACGFHGGDPLVMHRTLCWARENGVSVGAHPSVMDLWGFGRRRIEGEDPNDIERILIYQIGAIQGMAKAVGVPVTHFKVHGSLSNAAAIDPDLAAACARAVKATGEEMIFVAFPGSELERAAREAGLRVAREVYADRAYDDHGNLVSRKVEGSVIHDPEIAVSRVVRMAKEQVVTSISGKDISLAFDTICVHGDNANAVEMARRIRQALLDDGIAVRPMSEFVS